MKRCIICGNIGDENSTTCEKCGNPFVDMPTDSDAAEPVRRMHAGQKQDTIQEAEETAAAEPSPVKKAEPSGQRPQQIPPRRRKSGPQIYGQSEQMTAGADAQGSVRRTVSGRTPHSDEKRPAAPVNADVSGSLVNRTGVAPSDGLAGRLDTVTAGRVSAAPSNGAPADRPTGRAGTVPSNGAPAGRPAGRAGKAPSGRPVNRAGAAPTGRPSSGADRGIPGRPANLTGAVSRPLGAVAGSSSAEEAERKETARDALKSPLFIIIAVLNTIYIVSAVAAIFMKELNFSVAARLLSGVNLPTQFVGYMDKFLVLMAKLDTDAVLVNLVMRIPDLLFCIGLWLILVTAFAAKERMSGVGFGFVKATLIINMVKNCVIVLAGLIVSVALVVAAWVSTTGSMMVAAAVTLVIMIIAAMLIIMYYFCYMATFKTIRMNADGGEAYGNVSAYVAVVEILLALSCVLNLLSGVVNMEISAITGAVGKMGWMLLFAIWLLSYRNAMSEEER